MSDQQQDEQHIKFISFINRFQAGVKHTSLLGIEIVDASPKGITMKLPYSEDLVGNPETGVLHGGAISTLLDQTSGSAIICALYPNFDITPTIDLRIDHMRAAKPHQPVFAFAEAYRITKNVVFTRGFAFQDDRDDPFCTCVGTFMRMGFDKKKENWNSLKEGALTNVLHKEGDQSNAKANDQDSQ